MAKIINGQVIGSISKTTFLFVNGIGILRSKPGRGNVKQTTATKKMASVFGKASSMIHPLLNELAEELYFKMIMKNRGKVVSAAKDWLIKVPESTDSSLNSFLPAIELNDQVTLEKVLKVSMELTVAKDNKISLSMESFNPTIAILVPKKTDTIELKAVLITSHTDKDQAVVEKYPVTLEIPYSDAEVGEQTLQFPVQPEAGTVFLVALAICYKGYRINGMDRDRKWLPAGVLGLGRIA